MPEAVIDDLTWHDPAATNATAPDDELIVQMEGVRLSKLMVPPASVGVAVMVGAEASKAYVASKPVFVMRRAREVAGVSCNEFDALLLPVLFTARRYTV